MKKLLCLLYPLIFFLTACQHDESPSNSELPAWLNNKIQLDEKTIKDNPKSMVGWGVWVKTQWDENTYFEYSNLLSSSIYFPISFAGDTLTTYIKEAGSDYSNQKCCAEVVWHGSQIDEDYLKLFHNN